MKETSTKQLLSQVKTIIESYERLNEANGGNFNIFSVLGRESDEVTTHSRFIATLLNPHGVHGCKNQFLDLFIETLNIKKFVADNCQVSVETYLGKIDSEAKRGGSIDILIKGDGEENVIMIENKIYAGEQENQLLRYKNAYPKGKLLYLTLEGEESEQKSSKKIDYTSISYKYDMIKWLEECKKVVVSHPTLRETLTQYINLIKKLTHQNMNAQLNEDLAKLFTESPKNFDTLMAVKNLDIRKFIFENKIIPAFLELEKEIDGFGFEKDLNKLNKRYSTLCWVKNEKLDEKNLEINFEFEEKNTNYLIGFFKHIDKENKYDYTNMHKLLCLKEEFKRETVPKRRDKFPFLFRYDYYLNWTKDLNNLKNLSLGGEFKKDIRGKIETMLKTLYTHFKFNQ